jgi:hypothetical protein
MNIILKQIFAGFVEDKLKDIASEEIIDFINLQDPSIKGKLVAFVLAKSSINIDDLNNYISNIDKKKEGYPFFNLFESIPRFRQDPRFFKWLQSEYRILYQRGEIKSEEHAKQYLDKFLQIYDWYSHTIAVEQNFSLEEHNYESALCLSDRYHNDPESFISRITTYESTNPQNIIAHFNNGYTIQLITSKNDLSCEGNLMGHCSGDYYEYVSNYQSFLFSLRDKFNKPHVTLEFNIDGKLVQCKGKGNVDPIEKYQKMIDVWIKNTNILELIKKIVPQKEKNKWLSKYYETLKSKNKIDELEIFDIISRINIIFDENEVENKIQDLVISKPLDMLGHNYLYKKYLTDDVLKNILIRLSKTLYEIVYNHPEEFCNDVIRLLGKKFLIECLKKEMIENSNLFVNHWGFFKIVRKYIIPEELHGAAFESFISNQDLRYLDTTFGKESASEIKSEIKKYNLGTNKIQFAYFCSGLYTFDFKEDLEYIQKTFNKEQISKIVSTLKFQLKYLNADFALLELLNYEDAKQLLERWLISDKYNVPLLKFAYFLVEKFNFPPITNMNMLDNLKFFYHYSITNIHKVKRILSDELYAEFENWLCDLFVLKTVSQEFIDIYNTYNDDFSYPDFKRKKITQSKFITEAQSICADGALKFISSNLIVKKLAQQLLKDPKKFRKLLTLRVGNVLSSKQFFSLIYIYVKDKPQRILNIFEKTNALYKLDFQQKKKLVTMYCQGNLNKLTDLPLSVLDQLFSRKQLITIMRAKETGESINEEIFYHL